MELPKFLSFICETVEKKGFTDPKSNDIFRGTFAKEWLNKATVQEQIGIRSTPETGAIERETEYPPPPPGARGGEPRA